jgi:hypothetical protein
MALLLLPAPGSSTRVEQRNLNRFLWSTGARVTRDACEL